MDEVGAYFTDWDLDAVVRGCSYSTEPAPMEHPFIPEDNYNDEEDMFFSSFPELSESSTRVVLDELEELYKPFYPSSSLLHSTTTIVTPNPQPIIMAKEEEEQEDNVKVKPPPSSSSSSSSQKVAVAPPPQQLQQVIIPSSSVVSNKSKRRKKSVNKRVVKKVRAGEIGGGGCDAWAWRKYGQKPIKGSPYPRSYYRCSSSKGCLARKQVERNPLEPGEFLVTYTADHNHPHPTRRNSLAGTVKTTTTCPSSNSSAVRSVSPRTRVPLVVQSMDEQHNNNNNNNDDTTTTTAAAVTVSVTTTSISISISSNNKGLKEDADFVELLDAGAAAHHYWFPKTQDNNNTNNNNIIIDEQEMMLGLDYRLLEEEEEEEDEDDGCHFMHHHFAAAAAATY